MIPPLVWFLLALAAAYLSPEVFMDKPTRSDRLSLAWEDAQRDHARRAVVEALQWIALCALLMFGLLYGAHLIRQIEAHAQDRAAVERVQ